MSIWNEPILRFCYNRNYHTNYQLAVSVNLPRLYTCRVCKLAVSVNLPCLSTYRVYQLAVSVNLLVLYCTFFWSTYRVCKHTMSAVNLPCLSTCRVCKLACFVLSVNLPCLKNTACQVAVSVDLLCLYNNNHNIYWTQVGIEFVESTSVSLVHLYKHTYTHTISCSHTIIVLYVKAYNTYKCVHL